jgi:hypothetical protein
MAEGPYVLSICSQIMCIHLFSECSCKYISRGLAVSNSLYEKALIPQTVSYHRFQLKQRSRLATIDSGPHQDGAALSSVRWRL